MLLSLTALTLAQLPVLRPEVRVDVGTPGEPRDPVIAVEGGTALAAWAEAGPASLATDSVWAAVSSDHGRSWTQPLRVDQGGGAASRSLAKQSVAAAGGGLFVAWMDRRNGQADAWFRTRPAGAPPQPEMRLDDGFAPGAEDVRMLALQVGEDGQTVLVALATTGGGALAERVVVLRSTDGGATFGAPQRIGLSPTGFPFTFNVVDVRIAADGPDVHVVWQDQNFGTALWHQASADGGATWGPATELANGQLSENGQYDVAVVGDRVAVAYAEVSALCGVSVVMSDDAGATWTPPSRVGGSLSPACVDRSPSVFLAPQHVVVGWADDRQAIGERPYAAWSDDMGLTWTEQQLFPTYGRHVRIEGNPQTGVFGMFWTGQAQAYVKWSRALAPAPDTTFTLSAVGSGQSISAPALAYDPLYGDFLCAWRLDDPADDAVMAAGFRNAQVEALGPFTPGSLLSFAAIGFPETETGNMLQVLASLAPGGATLPMDGRAIGLAPGAVLSSTVGNPAFQAALLQSGVAATPLGTLPAVLPPGTQLHFAAVSHTVGPVMFGSLTDVVTRVVQ